MPCYLSIFCLYSNIVRFRKHPGVGLWMSGSGHESSSRFSEILYLLNYIVISKPYVTAVLLIGNTTQNLCINTTSFKLSAVNIFKVGCNNWLSRHLGLLIVNTCSGNTSCVSNWHALYIICSCMSMKAMLDITAQVYKMQHNQCLLKVFILFPWHLLLHK